MSPRTTNESSMTLVHIGWDHLRARRPLAAWASWQRALRQDPGMLAASQALGTLESASDLPESARMVYRLRQAEDPDRRSAWNDRLKAHDGNDQDLEVLADAFGRLASDTPSDSAAWYNRALCLAWLGANQEAISCLERVVLLEAAPAFDRAVAAWTLAEILRQGEGAEALADDLRFACLLSWSPGETSGLLEEFPNLRNMPTPRIPGIESEPAPDIEVYEWLDRRTPSLSEAGTPTRADDLPIALASVYVSRSAETLRLSSPRVDTLQEVEDLLLARIELKHRKISREASPLPFPFLDADVWTVRVPPDLEPHQVDHLMREWVEHYYENVWIHRDRHGLGSRSPIAAAREAERGDSVLLAKLTAVVNFREQLGRRPSALRLYQGYPFDRLRRRLGLEPSVSGSTDPSDLSCASSSELDALDVSSIDNQRLVEAVASAVGLRDDARTSALTTELIRRRPPESIALNLANAVSALIRTALKSRDSDAAIQWIDQARPLSNFKTQITLDSWRAEILARSGRPEEALLVYQALIDSNSSIMGASLALDGAETLLDNGHPDQAASLLETAQQLALANSRSEVWRRAQNLLDRL